MPVSIYDMSARGIRRWWRCSIARATLPSVSTTDRLSFLDGSQLCLPTPAVCATPGSSRSPAIESHGQLTGRELALDQVTLNAKSQTRRNKARLRGIGQDHNRRRPGFVTGTQGLEHRHAVTFRKFEVEKDEIGPRAGGQVYGRFSLMGQQNVMAVQTEPEGQPLRDIAIVSNKKHRQAVLTISPGTGRLSR